MSASGDDDRDGVPDGIETQGLWDIDGNRIVDMAAAGADPRHKDLFVELDWLPGQPPRRAEIEALRAAFARAPVDAGGIANPDGRAGINIHVDTGGLRDAAGNLVGDDLGGGNQVADVTIARLNRPQLSSGRSTFYATKDANFAPARAGIFRYGISGDPADAEVDGEAIGGQGELGGNDFLDFNHDAGTLMHELGHNLNLGHGGDEAHNCKPNYLSVMNYAYSSGIPNGGLAWTLDYFAGPPRRSAPSPRCRRWTRAR